MISDEREKLLEKIEALMRLRESSNPHEAALATGKVVELLQKYNLSEEEIVLPEKPEITRGDFSWTSGVIFSWELDLSVTIANHFMCRAFHNNRMKSKYARVTFIGRKINVEASLKVFSELRENFRTSASLAWRELEPLDRDSRDDRSFRNSWLSGALYGVQVALRRQKENLPPQTSALLVLREHEVDEFVKTKMHTVDGDPRSEYGHRDPGAFEEGYTHGRASMTPKLGGGK